MIAAILFTGGPAVKPLKKPEPPIKISLAAPPIPEPPAPEPPKPPPVPAPPVPPPPAPTPPTPTLPRPVPVQRTAPVAAPKAPSAAPVDAVGPDAPPGPPAPPSPPAPEAVAPAPPPPAAAPTHSATAEETYAAQTRAYLETLKHYPTSKEARLQHPRGEAEIWFVLERSGNLKEAGVESSSGSLILDGAALSLVRSSSYQPFPADAFVGQAEHRFKVRLAYALN